MTAFATKLAATLVAAAIAAGPLAAASASAKPIIVPKGPIIVKGPIFKKGPVFKGPIKIVKPVLPLKPLKPLPIKPVHHHHGHGAFWVLGGVTILATAYAGCGYEYYKWKSTDSDQWYEKYRDCRGWDD